ncbi:phosphatidylserine/phosphatidylglycerophosphate/cardiolipin synthase-like enzyme [Pseudomonas psychrotolerans]|nr:phosphatidylserine/phosphatidylglycerophosphate/cardiolipin synthase-like enzyme [Pseudomonas psychrotolerans]
MRGAVFPWRENNTFELLVDGGRFFPAMLDSIAGAQRQVDVELYLVEAGSCSERLLVALTEAARRGVTVRCLFDGFGTLRMDAELRRQLEDAGAEIRIFNPVRFGHGLHNLHRDHRKIFIVDGREAFVGGQWRDR